MQRKLLTILSLFLTPSLLLANGGYMALIGGYLFFIVPLALGTLDHFIVEMQFDIKKTQYAWSIIINLLCVFLGIPIVMFLVSLLHIDSDFTNIIISTTIWILLHSLIRLYYFRNYIIFDKREFPKVRIYVLLLNIIPNVLAALILHHIIVNNIVP